MMNPGDEGTAHWRHMRLLVSSLAAVLVGAVFAAPAWAEDSDRFRYYLQLRGQDTNPWTGVHDHWGLSLGFNFDRHWGLELSSDVFERDVEKGGRRLGEYGVVALVPQVRARYPLLNDRLVPYVVAGVGVAVTDFNDRKQLAPPGPRVESSHANVLAGTLGAGIEYYFADNLAAGVELKYLFADDPSFNIGGTRHTQQVSGLFTTVGLRVLVPELRPPAPAPDEIAPARLYIGARIGTAISTDTNAFSNAEIRPEPPAYFGHGNQFFGAVLGMDFGRHWGVELAADGYEVILATPTFGSLTEQALVHLIPQLRVRYPLLDGRVVPYALGGVGLSYAEINDRKRPSSDGDIQSSTYGVAAAVGAGIEYFVASNVALGLETRWVTDRGHTLRVSGREASGHYDAVITAFSLRVYLAGFGR